MSTSLNSEDSIHTLESLFLLDKQLHAAEGALARVRAAQRALEKNIHNANEQLTSTREQLQSLEKVRQSLLSELRSTSQQLDQSREKQGRARTEREINAVQREIEELYRILREREEEIKRTMAEEDRLHSLLEAGGERLKQYTLQLEALAKQTPHQPEVSSQHEEQRQMRKAFADKLPPVLLHRYEALFNRLGNPVAHTTRGVCSACNISIPPQLFSQLRRERSLDQCPSCRRILYFLQDLNPVEKAPPPPPEKKPRKARTRVKAKTSKTEQEEELFLEE